ncbi:glycosyltransferase family 8 protein [Ectobacillus sp. sgz5001026]|uniref:glycosyltransferase family 8 protein n=1 Tax=Ectobacillus sp. sgz5001026 TaxID=3242473 RepID=UPI0036D2B08B
MEEIHIVVATNNNYFKPLVTMLYSLYDHITSKNLVNIYIIDGNISPKNKLILKKALSRFKPTLKYLSVNESLYQNCNAWEHVSKESYYRISIPDLLDSAIPKVLYLDCDLIIKDDITKLWNIDIDPYFIAAVEDPNGENRYTDLLFPACSGHFNSGVMLINLEKWRNHHISNKVLQFIKDNPDRILWGDQDALNAILHDKWLKLHYKWNFQVFRMSHLVMKPAIIHYNTNIKPWNGITPLQEEYQKYWFLLKRYLK